jgi:hypothetical protein
MGSPAGRYSARLDVRLLTRAELDWTAKCPSIAWALALAYRVANAQFYRRLKDDPNLETPLFETPPRPSPAGRRQRNPLWPRWPRIVTNLNLTAIASGRISAEMGDDLRASVDHV